MSFYFGLFSHILSSLGLRSRELAACEKPDDDKGLSGLKDINT